MHRSERGARAWPGLFTSLLPPTPGRGAGGWPEGLQAWALMFLSLTVPQRPTVPTVACASKRTLTVPTGSTCQTIQCLHPRTATLDLFQFMPISCLPKALSYRPGPLLLCASLAVVSLNIGFNYVSRIGFNFGSVFHRCQLCIQLP